jgi:predicted nucleotidyltransferase
MVAAGLPDGVMDRILEVLQPEEVWLFGSRARETHGPDSDWDLMAVLPDSASDDRLDLGALWPRLRDLRRLRVDVFPIRRRDFDQDRRIFGELAEAVAREGRRIHGR